MKYFITFGAGESCYYDAGNRLLQQANNLGIFDKTYFFKDDDLKNDPQFWPLHSNFIENNKRGYGYWLWKPYLIKKTMESMEDGDILLYLDCGCELDIRRKNILEEYFELVKREYIVGTHICIEKDFNKMDLIKKLDMLNDAFLNSPQHQAGAILFLVCDKTRELVNKWYEIGSDYHNIDDSPSIDQNLNCFIEHRHDQSIFSLLTKKYNLYSSHSLHNCVSYIRNKSGISKL
jgi:hypothetical protein